MMRLFHVLDDMFCILLSRGTYKQAELYRRGEHLYAKHGSGFVRLMARGGTSAPNVSWVDMNTNQHVKSSGGRINAPRHVHFDD